MLTLISSCSADGLSHAAKAIIAQDFTSQYNIYIRYMCHSPTIMDRP